MENPWLKVEVQWTNKNIENHILSYSYVQYDSNDRNGKSIIESWSSTD